MAQTVPVVEITDDTDAVDAWRPDAEQTAIDTVDRLQVRAEEAVSVQMLAGSEQVEIEIADLRSEAVGRTGVDEIA